MMIVWGRGPGVPRGRSGPWHWHCHRDHCDGGPSQSAVGRAEAAWPQAGPPGGPGAGRLEFAVTGPVVPVVKAFLEWATF